MPLTPESASAVTDGPAQGGGTTPKRTPWGGPHLSGAVLAEGLVRRCHKVLVYCQEQPTVRATVRPLFPAAWAPDLHTPFASQ
jgi:hypothetical protein